MYLHIILFIEIEMCDVFNQYMHSRVCALVQIRLFIYFLWIYYKAVVFYKTSTSSNNNSRRDDDDDMFVVLPSSVFLIQQLYYFSLI